MDDAEITKWFEVYEKLTADEISARRDRLAAEDRALAILCRSKRAKERAIREAKERKTK